MSKIGKFTERDKRLMVARTWGEGWELRMTTNKYKVSFEDDGNILWYSNNFVDY